MSHRFDTIRSKHISLTNDIQCQHATPRKPSSADSEVEQICDEPKPIKDINSIDPISLFRKSTYELLHMSSHQGFRVIKGRL